MFEPENGTESAREEDAFHSGKGNYSFRKRTAASIAPVEGPLGLLFDAVDGGDSLKKTATLSRIVCRVSVNEQGVDLVVDVFDGGLEGVEAAGLR